MKPSERNRTSVRSASPSEPTSSPSNRTAPSLGVSSRPISCKKVLLPDPGGPTTATISPASMHPLASRRATTSASPTRYLRHTWSISSRTGQTSRNTSTGSTDAALRAGSTPETTPSPAAMAKISTNSDRELGSTFADRMIQHRVHEQSGDAKCEQDEHPVDGDAAGVGLLCLSDELVRRPRAQAAQIVQALPDREGLLRLYGDHVDRIATLSSLDERGILHVRHGVLSERRETAQVADANHGERTAIQPQHIADLDALASPDSAADPALIAPPHP